MGFIQRAKDRVVGAVAGAFIGAERLSETADAVAESVVRDGGSSSGLSNQSTDPLSAGIIKGMESAFAELELAFEDIGWRGTGGSYSTFNFTRATLRRITALSRVMYLINPLIRRAISVQELYVWGRGVKIKGEIPVVDEVIQDFFKARKNQRIIGAAWAEREREQRMDGNTFFVFYVNKLNGTCRLRLLPFDQVETIIFNPEDGKEPWLYCRQWTGNSMAPGLSGIPEEQPISPTLQKVYYPDIDYDPIQKPGQWEDGSKIDWSTRVYHLKTGGLSAMRFGVPELFSALNWATGYKKILENFATVIAAYARLAMQITGLPGKYGVAASKSKMQTGVNSSRFLDNNPSTNTASWFLASGNAKIEPVKTAGSTTGPDEARALRSMVAAGSDTPEHFFGDSDVGNFATSETLDRPTELKMTSRQDMWASVIDCFCEFLIKQSALAPYGKLRKAGYDAQITRDSFDGSRVVTVVPPANGNLNVLVQFPNILERDVTDRVRSVVQAATLGGAKAEGIIPNRKVLCRMLMEALGEEDAERLTDLLYPADVMQGFIDPAEVADDEHLAAQGKKELGDAALISAKTKPSPGAPAPKSGAPARGGSNVH